MNAGEALASAQGQLEALGVPEARASAEFILAATLKSGRNEAVLYSSRQLTPHQDSHFRHLVSQRGRRIPLAYILGSQPFLGLEIAVTREALIPRPETEELVCEALGLFIGREGEPLQILEIGTGTGCIAVALSSRLPNATVYATDISPAALALAAKNAEAHHRGRSVRFIREDLFKPEGARLGWADLVISNPPYIPTAELRRLDAEVLHEPVLALDGGPDGLSALKAVIAQAPRHLKPGGSLALEIGAGQGAAVTRLMEAAGFGTAEVRRDASGLERFALGKMVNWLSAPSGSVAVRTGAAG